MRKGNQVREIAEMIWKITEECLALKKRLGKFKNWKEFGLESFKSLSKPHLKHSKIFLKETILWLVPVD